MAKLMKAASRGIPLAARTPKWLAPHPSAIAPAAASGVRAASGIPRDAALLHVRNASPDRDEPRRARKTLFLSGCVWL